MVMMWSKCFSTYSWSKWIPPLISNYSFIEIAMYIFTLTKEGSGKCMHNPSLSN
ncbi:hypothetical protein Lalb_Chr24g0397201 [Lupinus albus]|uniref:Uncharacterized protein n=1 Tax=Lupinus albus TaxID=3870 RepID=A0A6A4N782_LUPAL|nr:hypothetical protein Lalb_Chr24g0397201 [Lupinus albus]